MHSVAFTYPENASPEVRAQYIDFYRSLGPVIPCPSCGKHYMEYMEKNPIDADNRDSIAKWVYDLHEDVNKRSKKQGVTWEQVKEDYTGWTQEKNNDLNKGNRRSQLKKLADPHLGRNIQLKGASENQMGMDDGMQTKSIVAVLAAFALFYFIRRLQQKRRQNTPGEVTDNNKSE